MVALLAAGVSAAGSIMGGQAQASADKANAYAALQNSEAAQMTAKANAATVEQSVQRRLGEARAAMGASGADANTGSPLSVMRDLANQGELKRRLELYSGQTQSRKFAQEAALDKAQATASLNAGWWQAGSTVLTAADKAANNWFPATMASMGG